MEPRTVVQGVSFTEAPRKGQLRVFEEILRPRMNIQLPTGYGKTRTALGVFSILKAAGDVNKLLYIVPRKAQLDQLLAGAVDDLKKVSCPGSHRVYGLNFHGHRCVSSSLQGKTDVFGCTLQSLLKGKCRLLADELLRHGDWMLVIDEYHHYGEERQWSSVIRDLEGLNCRQVLAMSATPYRPRSDSYFGPPDVVVTYREASEERAVKVLRGHAYNYRLDVETASGEELSFTTGELFAEVGAESAEAVEQFLIKRKMRWSPKYIHPLVSIPIERMTRLRLRSGHKLQVLVTAMCCSHAEMVCEQIASMFPNLAVDWVGTGQFGRDDKTNDAILRKFNPDKVNGVRRREDVELDVLVHVGICAEGVDTSFVSEVVHLHSAAITNTTNQINGRASRYLAGVDGFINFDSSSDYSQFVGKRVMDVMDGDASACTDEENAVGEVEPDWDEWPTDQLPEEPQIVIYDMELTHVDEGELATMLDVMSTGMRIADVDPDDPETVAVALSLLKNTRARECEEMNAVSAVNQLEDRVNDVLREVTGFVKRIYAVRSVDLEELEWRDIIGEVKFTLNDRKKRRLGGITKDCEQLKRHYKWLREVRESIVATRELPEWLRFESIVESLRRRILRKSTQKKRGRG